MENATQNGTSNGLGSSSRRGDLSFTEMVKEQPVMWLAIAAAAGFVLGGGVRRSNGVALLMLIGQTAMRDALGQFVSDTLGNSHAGG